MKTVFGAMLLLAATTASATTLEAVAGTGGVTRPGRWTPVFVSVDAGASALDAELVVSWGDQRVRRPVHVAAGARNDYELYVRTRDARGTIDVQIMKDGREAARVSARVDVLGTDNAATLCIVNDVLDDRLPDCTAHERSSALPRSPRGYETFDRVRWIGPRVALAPDQETALRAWRSLKDLDASGDLGLTPQARRPLVARGLPSGLLPVVTLVSGGYLVALTVAAFTLRARRATVALSTATLAAVTACGCAAMATVGQVGATRAVRVHHVSVLQQLPGTDRAMLSMRGIAEFPAFDRFALRLDAVDAALETASVDAGIEQRVDTDGFPVIGGVFGLAGRQGFSGEAIVRAQPLAIVERGTTVEIENRSTVPLHDCRLGRGLTGGAAALAAGARTTAEIAAPTDESPAGPLITCVMDEAPVSFTEARRPVVMQGPTTIAAYRAPATRGAAGD